MRDYKLCTTVSKDLAGFHRGSKKALGAVAASILSNIV